MIKTKSHFYLAFFIGSEDGTILELGLLIILGLKQQF